MSFHSALYRGEIMHARHDALARRAFRYPVYVAALDLDELPALDRELRLFSRGRRNLFAFDPRDYGESRPGAGVHGDPEPDLAGQIATLLAGAAIAPPVTTRLVTNLRAWGYVFNPVSFFLNYDDRGQLASVIAEVNNTYGGRFRYVLGPAERLPDHHGRVGFRHVRELFVSPFLHGPMTYEFWFDAPLDGDHLTIAMHVRDAPAPQTIGTRVFAARLVGRRRALSDRALAAAALRYPLMTAQVIGLIHWQALKLRLAGVPYRRPGPDHRPLDSRRFSPAAPAAVR